MADARRALALALLGWAGAGLAAVPRQPAPAADPAATVAHAAELARGDDCAGVLRLLDPLVAQPVPDNTRVAAQMLRLPCLTAAGRSRDADAALADVRARAPNNPLLIGYQVFADAAAGRDGAAADGLARLADSGSPTLGAVPGSLWRALAQKLTVSGDVARRDRTALALARAGWSPPDEPDLAAMLPVDGIAALLAGPDADPDQARALLAKVDQPELLDQMAIDGRYRALWPAIEARLGPAGGAAVDRFATAALARFADAPDDDHARLDAARAFVALGRPDDVIATAVPVPVAAGIGEDRVDTIALGARARAYRGDLPGAIARLAPFAAIDLVANPPTVSALIELAEYQHQARRYDDELATARRLIATGDKALSPFGVQWARRDELCALAGLGRRDEARAAGDALVAAAPANQAAAIEGLLCAGRDEDAARIAVTTLGSPDGGRRLADQFQPTGAVPMASRTSLRDLWARLLARPDVAAAFAKTARILPRPLWPAATPRPLPAPRDGADVPTA